MAQPIGNLPQGTKVKDSKGNIFQIVYSNKSNYTTLWEAENKYSGNMSNGTKNIDYASSYPYYFINNEYPHKLDPNLLKIIPYTSYYYTDYISAGQTERKLEQDKFFLFEGSDLQYSSIRYRGVNYWTRTEAFIDSNGYSCFQIIDEDGDLQNVEGTVMSTQRPVYICPAFRVPISTLVTDNSENGVYSFVFNQPPVLSSISNVENVLGTASKIVYTATDSDDADLMHFFSIDNGSTWSMVYPTREGDTYTYSHVFNEIGTYNCRIRVVDSIHNDPTSNMFTVTVKADAPVVDIVDVVGETVTFKTNCVTSEITKVEVLINDEVKKTFSSDFDLNMSYEIDKNDLNIGKNSMKIISTSDANLVGYVDLEITKSVHELLPIGSKVVINDDEYLIVNSSKNDSIHTYTLDSPLVKEVNKDDDIQIYSDTVKVLCSLTNLENSTDFKPMKLVKTKKLKGSLEGYVEEKYELESEGRYSAIKLELERFNSNVESEIIELQQYFDYMQD